MVGGLRPMHRQECTRGAKEAAPELGDKAPFKEKARDCLQKIRC